MEEERPSEYPGLCCSADVDIRVSLPNTDLLRFVPGFLLSQAGNTIVSAVLKYTVPSFLELLAADYRRWALHGAFLPRLMNGENRLTSPSGSLLPPPSPR